MDDDQYVCYGCGSFFAAGDLDFDAETEDMEGQCPECGSKDIESYAAYVEGLE